MNNYHIYEEIGRGKYSVVYKGRKKKSIDYVAVKSVERCRRRKLMNEVRIFHNLNHRNILRFNNWYETRNHLWIIAEYCPGGDLFRLLEEDKKLPEKTVKKFAKELIEGLSYLHENSIIFCDLKPSNILFNEFSGLKLCDFGLSKKIQDLVETTTPEGDAQQAKHGTPYYMAPELFQDNGTHSFYSDFWSLGCILFELATGKPPFCTNSLKHLIQMIIEEETPEVSNFSEDFNDLLLKLLEKDPCKRISWPELKSHKYWTASKPVYEFDLRLIYPDQPHFDRYLESRNIVPAHFYEQRKNPLAQKFMNMQSSTDRASSAGSVVDIMRLSHNVRRNIKKEEEENVTEGCDDEEKNYHKKDTSGIGSAQGGKIEDRANSNSQHQKRDAPDAIQPDDIKLQSRNVVLNFGEKTDEETDAAQNVQAQDLLVKDLNQPKLNRNSSGGGNYFHPPAQPNAPAQPTPPSAVQAQAQPEVQLNHYKSTPNVPQKQETQHQKLDRQKSSPNQYLNNNFVGGPLTDPVANPGISKTQQSKSPTAVPSTNFSSTGSGSAQPNMMSGNRPLLKNQTMKNTITPMVDEQQPSASTGRKGSGNRAQHASGNFIDPQQNQMTNLSGAQKVQSQKKPKSSPLVAQVHLQSSPQDLALLAGNQLFKAYQVPQVGTNFNNKTVSDSGTQQQPQQLVESPSQNQFAINGSQNRQLGTNSSHGGSTTSGSSKVPHKTIEQLIIHNSDTQVKPIIGNKEIEKIHENSFNPSALSFEPWLPEDVVAKIDTSEIETHLSDVYSAMANNVTVNEKMNALSYFESIIVNSNVSNRLINSAFMNLLVKMLKGIKQPVIKAMLCSVVGLLIRHSTVIENELAESEICQQLVETMREKSEKVRRRAIAALGEYMFYAATQLDDEQVDPVWELSPDAIQVIVRNLRIVQTENGTEDDVVRFYACKTLENICAQSNSAGHKFTTLEPINHLLTIFLNHPVNTQAVKQGILPPTFYEGLKTSAAVALSHICRLNSQLFPIIFERITAPVYCQTLTDGHPRVQQAFITMLNLAINANVFPKINEVLLAEPSFLHSLKKLHEHHSIVIRGKCLLTFLLLFKLDFRWMSVVKREINFFNILDRVLRDNYKYVQCCLLCLIDGILEIVPTIFQTVAEELSILIQGGKPHLQASEFDHAVSKDLYSQLKRGGNIFYIQVIVDLQNNQIIRNRMLNYPFIRALSSLLDNTTLLITSGDEKGEQIGYEFQKALFLVAENISSNQKVLLHMHEAIINYLLPVLLSKLKLKAGGVSQVADVEESRFSSLKIMTDMLIHLLSEDSIYVYQQALDGSTPGTKNGQISQSTIQLNQFLLQGLLPLAGNLLTEQSVSIQCQRLLSAIFDRNLNFVKALRSLTPGNNMQLKQEKDVVAIVCEFYQVKHPNLNKHTINIVKAIIEVKELSFVEMKEFRIIEKTSQLINNMLANKQEWCIELLLDINHDLLSRFNEVVKTREKEIGKLIDEILDKNFDYCIRLLSLQFEITIAEKASQCLIQMLQLYALCQEKKKEIFFVELHMGFLMNALKCDKRIIQKRVLKCIYWALIQSEYTLNLEQAQILELTTMVESLLNSGDRSINQTSKEIYKILKEQNSHYQQQKQQQQVDSQKINFYQQPAGNL